MGFVGDFIGDITGSNDAADAQEKAAENSIAEQRRQFDYMVDLMNPYNQAGMSSLANVMTMPGI